MFPEQKNNWLPGATLNILKKRAAILQSIREFFHQRGVMEVETPLMCHTSVTDPFIQSIPVLFNGQGQQSHSPYYLQTSPEYAMKRLLAAGSGAIFQIGKAFRQDETGRLHNPEFTMLEWYRPGYDHHELMNEMDDLLQCILNTAPAKKMSYRDLFLKHLDCDPFLVSNSELSAIAALHHIRVDEEINDIDTWLQILMSHCIEPTLAFEQPCFIYDFPPSQAALSRLRPGNPPLASRFEVYYQGIELANGFHELANAAEQRRRFENNNLTRKKMQLPLMKIDEFFLAALEHGLPDCAGVALGIDRLVMLATGEKNIANVMSFDIERV